MLSFERQQQILEILHERQCVPVETLCKELFASGATIRRDLTEMERRGLIVRVHGGAALLEGSNHDRSPLVRANQEREKKEQIARLALRYTADSSSYFMDSSSTAAFLAEKMGALRGVSVVTNGLATANALNERTAAQVYLCGGLLKNRSSVIGGQAVDMVQSFHADIFFFSCCGLSAQLGTMEADEEMAAVKREMCRSAEKRILLCDSTKFGRSFFCRACPPEQVDLIVTDRKPSGEFLELFGGRVVYP